MATATAMKKGERKAIFESAKMIESTLASIKTQGEILKYTAGALTQLTGQNIIMAQATLEAHIKHILSRINESYDLNTLVERLQYRQGENNEEVSKSEPCE